jgi:hypothetical protein
MKRAATRFPAFPLIAVLAACGGASEETSDSSMGGESQTPEQAVAAAGLDCYLAGATPEEARERVSPHSRLAFVYDGHAGLLCYGAPSARGREIMGGLVPYNGEPWRIGADEPTTIHLSAAASVGGVQLDPGSYSLYAIPAEGDWEFLVNTNYERWGIPINADVRESEIGSFTLSPETTDSFVETLDYAWDDGAIVMTWENTRFRIPVEGM